MPFIDYTGAMPNGMNRDWRSRVNVPFFETVKGLQATELGLKQYQPFTTLTAPSFPFPDIFVGKRVQLAFGETTVIDLTGPTTLTVYDFLSYDHTDDSADVGAITAGSQWHFMDNYDSWMAFNGVCVVFKAAFSTKVFVSDYTTILTGCNLIEGRALLAGFDDGDGIWTNLKVLLEDAQAQLPDQLQDVYQGMDSTWAMWTSVGGPEILGLLNIAFLKYGWFDDNENTGFDDANLLLTKLLSRGEWGARPLLCSGAVLKALPMGAFAMVYQSGGCNALWPSTEPMPSYGIVNPSTGTVGIQGLPEWVGPLGRGCVGGDHRAHLMLSSENDLWLIEREGFKATNFKGSHNLAALVPATVRISLDPVNRDFYICGLDGDDDPLSFCFSESGGLTRCPKTTPSISVYGGTVGAWAASVDASAIEVMTMPFSAGHPQINLPLGTVGTLKGVRIATMRGDSTDGWKVVVYYRLRIVDTWTATAAVSFDDRGVAAIEAPGIEWKVLLTHDDCTKTIGLDQLFIELDFSGKLPVRQWINAADPAVMPVPTP